MIKYWLIIILCCILIPSQGIEPTGKIYWVQLNTKDGTPYTLDKPEEFLSQKAILRRLRHNIAIDSTDLPVNPAFIDSLQSMGFYIKHTSRWMNGVIVVFPDTVAVESLKLPTFVSYIQLRKDAPLKSVLNKFDEIDSLTSNYYGNSTNQVTMLNGHLLHKFSKGEGVQVAVIDAGFQDADKLDVFDSLFERDGIIGTYDFVSPGNSVYNEHSHGTNVLSIMAGSNPGRMVGTAPNALYWLLRSEDVDTESPVEEDYWIIAAEFADSVGCDVINTSLGYTTFDNPKFDHNYGEFTGDSLRISRASNLAVKKGIVVVCSAGNSGNDSWYYISAPSEARDVLSVAAVNGQREIAAFSSRGFGDSLHSIKPDIAAMGAGTAIAPPNGSYSFGSGTSYSSPVMAGMAACLVGLYPDSSAYSIIAMIRKAGDRYPGHSVEYGYGIPDFGKYIDTNSLGKPQLQDKNKIIVYPNPFTSYFSVSNPNLIDKIELISFDGRSLLTARRGNPQLYGIPTANLDHLPKGVYIARIWSGNTVQTLKLIKK
jgi:subtilisin family serine protease